MPKPYIRRTGLSLPALTLLMVGACDSPTAPPAEAAADTPAIVTSHGTPAVEVPFRWSGVGYLQGQDFAPGFGPPAFGKSLFGGRCSVPSDFVIRFSVEGEASQLGAVTAELEHCTRIDWITGQNTLIDGVATITAANGDELWDRYERLVGAPGTPETHWFVGGTGLFVGASGGGLASVRCDPAAGTCDFALEGSLVYHASNRSQ